MNLEGFPKELSRSFDEYVGIGDTIKNGLDYAKVLAMVLVPELVKERDFSKVNESVDTKCDALCLTHSKPKSVASIGFPGTS